MILSDPSWNSKTGDFDATDGRTEGQTDGRFLELGIKYLNYIINMNYTIHESDIKITQTLKPWWHCTVGQKSNNLRARSVITILSR